jgi:hypothetical protein
MGSKRSEKRGSGKEASGENGGFRVPPVMMIPVGVVAGWLMGDWLGGILGGVIGVFLWRSRGN